VQALLHLQKTGTDNVAVAVSLLQGVNTIATRSFTPGTSFALFSMTLTAAEQALITDYTNLHLRVSTLPNCDTSPMPATVHATLSNNIRCICASGTIALIWNGTAWVGTGPFGVCGRNITLTLTCPPGNTGCGSYTLAVSFSDNCDGGTGQSSPVSCTCSPLSMRWTYLFPTQACGCGNNFQFGAFNIVITT
jgi:hypothetical protein